MTDLAANKALVLAFWESSADDKGRLTTDDVEWHLPISVATRSGFTQDLRGDDVRALFTGGQAMYQPERTWDIWHVVADDNLVALHCTMHALTASGNDYHGSYHMLFRIEGDRIAEAWEFLDTAVRDGTHGPEDRRLRSQRRQRLRAGPRPRWPRRRRARSPGSRPRPAAPISESSPGTSPGRR